MKQKTYCVLLFFFGCTLLLAQNPFPENKAIWKEQEVTLIGLITQHYALCGDTLIDAKNYSKVLNLQVDSDLNVTGETYAGGIRSDGGAVMFKPDNEMDEYVLFDFNLEAGDSIDLITLYDSQPITRYVDSVKMEMIGGDVRKVIYFEPGYPSAPIEFWMEGVGSNFGLLGRAIDLGGDIGFSLLCFGHEDTYVNLTLIECFLPELEDCSFVNTTEYVREFGNYFISPNPASGKVKINYDGELNYFLKIEMLNVEGRIVSEFFIENNEEIQLDIGGHNSGLYFFKIMDGKTEEVYDVLKLIIGN